MIRSASSHVGVPVEPAGARLLAGNRTRTEKLTVRANTDPFGDGLYTPEADLSHASGWAEVAAEHGVPSAPAGSAWLWRKPGVTAPIVGARPTRQRALAAEQLKSEEAEPLRPARRLRPRWGRLRRAESAPRDPVPR